MSEVVKSPLEKWATLSLEAHDTCPDKIYDLYYDRLLSDPIGSIRGIYNHFGLVWSDIFEEHLQTYLFENPKDKYGKQNYTSSDFGMTDAIIAKHFTEYSKRFDFAS